MHELLPMIMSYVRGIWRYRWLLLIQSWIICLAGWYVVMALPNQYQTSAKVFVDTQSVLRPLLQGIAVHSNIEEQVQLMTERMLSRPNLEKVIRATDLDLNITDESGMDGLANNLKSRMEVRRCGGRNLYCIKFTHENPQLAKDVVQSMLTLFVESSLGASRQDTNKAQQFFDEQIRKYEARLEAAENRLKEFKRKNVGLMPSSGQDYYQRLQNANAELKAANLKLTEATRRRDELRRQISGEEPSFGFGTGSQPKSAKVAAIESRIESLRTRLDSLLLQYTERHPDIVALKNTIEQLETQKAQVIKNQSTSASPFDPPPDVEVNPVYQRMKIALSEAEAQVATMRVRRREFESRVRKLEKLVDTVPKVEADLAKLNRDYDITKRNYEAFLARRESASISQDVEQKTDDVQFKIVEPPRVPRRPVAPNRPLFLTAVLLGGLGLGVGLAFFLSQIRPTYDSKRTLSQAVGLPVLGSVSMVLSNKAKLRRNLSYVYYGVTLAALIVLFAGIQVSLFVEAQSTSTVLLDVGKGSNG